MSIKRFLQKCKTQNKIQNRKPEYNMKDIIEYKIQARKTEQDTKYKI